MAATHVEGELRRFLEICNACRYCEGYCSVFPALELRRQFLSGDLNYLANLCHDCRGCYYSCQYAPPHEFALNLPRAFSAQRLETYEKYAWPGRFAAIFRRNGIWTSALALACIALFLILALPIRSRIQAGSGGSFYRIVPENAMIGITGSAFLFSVFALTIGIVRFWRNTNGPAVSASSLSTALVDVLSLRNLGGGGDGCNYKDESFSRTRRYYHHSLFYGFLFCFASTCTAAFYEHVLGRISPYPLSSLPVLLGTVGGIGMLIGIGGLVRIKVDSDPLPASHLLMNIDYCFLILLFVVAATGLLLLVVRWTAGMSTVLAIHLGIVVALFLMLPYCKFVHGLYRAAALVRFASERPSRK